MTKETIFESKCGKLFTEKMTTQSNSGVPGLEVSTYIGQLTATANTDSEYPGISIEYTPKGESCPIEVAFVEVNECKKVVVHLYTNPYDEDYTGTFEIAHEDALAAVQSSKC